MMNSIKDIEEAFHKLVGLACEIVEARKAYFMVFDRDSSEIGIKAAKGFGQEIDQKTRFILPENVIAEVINIDNLVLIKTRLNIPFHPSLLENR